MTLPDADPSVSEVHDNAAAGPPLLAACKALDQVSRASPSSMDAPASGDQLVNLAGKVQIARARLRKLDAQHPVVLDVGYALKLFAQWRSLDMPSSQRPVLDRELRSAAESCRAALHDPELQRLASE